MVKIVDYIEKSLNYWEDKPVAVVFLPECNLACIHCNQWRLVRGWEKLPLLDEADVLKGIAKNRSKLDGVVITGGEPTLQVLDDFIRTVKSYGLGIKLETNGFNSTYLERLLRIGMVNFVSVDIKNQLDSKKYQQVTGVPIDITEIATTIYKLIGSSYDYEFTTTLIPGVHTAVEVEAMAKSVKGAKRFVIQRLEPSNKVANIKPFSEEELQTFAGIASEYVPTVIR